MTSSIRIGIVGAGGNTRGKHIPKLQEIDGVSIEVICNRSTESSQAVADEFGVPRIANHWKEVVADPEVDAVVIGTWPYLHAPITIAALEAGKHVLCEARMAMDLTEAEAMMEASKAHPHQVTQVVPSPFTLKWDRYLKRILEEGIIGQVLNVDVISSGGFLNPDSPITWREQRKFSGLNAMMLGIYYEAMARWLGHAKTVEATARVFLEQRIGTDGKTHSLEIPDHIDAFGCLESGASYHVRCSNVTGACPTPNDFIIYGVSGTLRLNISDDTCTLHRPESSVEILNAPREEHETWRVEEEFIGAIRGEETIRLTSFEEGVRYMAFTQRVMESAGMV